jgi:hypothetical protein
MAINTTQKQAAKQFVERWTGKGYEKGETQRFWLDLLHNVFGVDDPTKVMQFEIPVKTITKEKGSDFIDGYIAMTKVLIEQKGSRIDLSAKAKQSDGAELTAYQQGRRYAEGLPLSQKPRWIVACNFLTFEVHDMEHPNDAPEVIQLADLEKEFHRLSFLVDDANAHIKKELEVSIKAGEIVGVLYDKFLAQYKNPDNLESQKALNKLCVRLVFCLYAEDAGIFGSKNMFHDYMAQFTAADFRSKLIELFHVLDIKLEDRDPYMDEQLAAFPYVNGGMFSGDIEIPRITEEIRSLILQRASDDFDWSLISPTIFGAVFESTLNPETRRAGGMHYTSIENIHKVIDPLFLDGLMAELVDIKATTAAKAKKDKALAFQNKLASLKFLDPACGSGNFLTESYTSLRRLENEALRIIYGSDRIIGEMADPIKVSISQFYGIEINDFACAVAQTALWIAESQMMLETDEIVGFNLDPLPLKRYANIKEGNALRMSWFEWEEPEDLTTVYADEVYIHQYLPSEDSSFVATEPEVKYGAIEIHSHNIHQTDKTPRTRFVQFDYIMGNPPFLGARVMSAEQKDDLVSVFGAKWKNIGNMDYVTGWYKKTAEMMNVIPKLHAALVSTNSITQGEQVANLWKPLMERGIHIDFAWRTFIWDSEASQKAHVHCVIVGFSSGHSDGKRRIFDGESVIEASNINGYLIDGENVFVESRQHPLCDVPEIGIGNKPIDGGLYLFKDDEKEAFIKKEPGAEKYFKRWYGSDEFINRRPRWCLWLGDANPVELLKLPECMKRIEAVRNYRLASPSPGTVKLADRPTRFHVENMPKGNYLLIPETSSVNRVYIPMGFMSSDVLCSNAVRLIPNASLYHFGILTSSVHNAWMRVVCGRLKSDFRYSKDIVYNNFPWPMSSTASLQSQEQSKQLRDAIANIEKTAQAILDARDAYPEASFADMYGNLFLFPELLKAHRANDAAVMEAYGFPKDATEAEIVARLFKLYQELAEKK